MESPDEPRWLTSAFESPTFGEDSSIRVEQPIGAASISPCGRDVVLASKEGLHIIDLDTPYSPPRYLPHHTPWEVADVQWSPFGSRDYWIASTSNQKALVWNLSMSSSQDPIEHVLHAHDRAITDINFSAHHPDILATCAVDSFVHCWDLRATSRPAISFSDWFAGATQVKWNRQDSHVIASAHDKTLRIWDDRMGAMPLRSIIAHDTKIYGVDWNRVRPMAIATCSLDKTIKLWDCEANTAEQGYDVPEKVIRTPFPVWRARHTPFGWGLLAMPQRGSHDLHLYDRRAGVEAISTPVHSFAGHTGQVKEFLWRARGGVSDGVDNREFQLVTWGADKELKLHKMTDDAYESIHYKRGQPAANMVVSRKDAKYRTFRDDPVEWLDYFDGSSTISPGPSLPLYNRQRGSLSIGMSKVSMPRSKQGWLQGGQRGPRIGMNAKTTVRQDTNPIAWMRGVKVTGWDEDALEEEIKTVGSQFSKVNFEAADTRQRKATITLHGPWGQEGQNIFLKVDLKFPSAYPRGAAPTFTVQRTSSVKDQLAITLSGELKKIASSYLVHKKGCLEAVIRYLIGENTLQDTIDLVEKSDATAKMEVEEPLEEESSSDEEVDGVGPEFQGPDLSLSNSELFRPVNQNVMVPVAKACGAFWAPNGQLVCFFPPKKDKSESFLENFIGLRDLDSPRTDKAVFEGFGRLQTRSPDPKRPGGTATTGGDDAASDSDESFTSSSSSSGGSTDLMTSIPAPFQAPQAWRGPSLGIRRARSADHSQRSTTAATNKSALDTPKSIISIRDFSDLLPAKRQLAEEYQISGEPSDICAHNSRVAKKYGNYDLARVWGLIALVLQRRVPHEMMLATRQTTDIFALAYKILRMGKRRDSGVEFGGSENEKVVMPELHYTQWGANPLGGRWLIPALFDYFERTADVQMLAMLSCIFYEPDTPHDPFNGSLGKPPKSNIANHPLVLPIKSLTYRLHRRDDISKDEAMQPSRRKMTRGDSRTSEMWYGSNSPTPFGTEQTPPWPAQSDKSGTSGSVMNAISVSESPEYRFLRHSNSNLANFASSLSKNFSLSGNSMSVSPETHGARKRASPAGSFTGIPSLNSGAWGSNTRSNRSFNAGMIPENNAMLTLANAPPPPPSTRSPPPDTDSAVASARKGSRKIMITYKNRDKFDEHATTHVPLLDPHSKWRYSAYRAAYAHLLSNWGLPVTRAEILKYDGFQGTDDTKSAPILELPQPDVRRRSSMSMIGPRTVTEKAIAALAEAEPVGLNIQRHCVRCAAPLPEADSGLPGNLPIFLDGLRLSDSGVVTGANGTTTKAPLLTDCTNCALRARVPAKVPCAVCGELAKGVLVPCLECGHTCCLDCHRTWFFDKHVSPKLRKKAVLVKKEDRSCPSGCGCTCTHHSAIDAMIVSADSETVKGVENSAEAELTAPKQATKVARPTPSRKSTSRTKPSSRSYANVAASPSPSPSPAPSAAVSALKTIKQPLSPQDHLLRNHSRSQSITSSIKSKHSRPKITASSRTSTTSNVTTSSTALRDNCDYGSGATTPTNASFGSGTARQGTIDEATDELLETLKRSTMATFGRGVGGGLSRGMSSESSAGGVKKTKRGEE